jgi:hypothetical protein
MEFKQFILGLYINLIKKLVNLKKTLIILDGSPIHK